MLTFFYGPFSYLLVGFAGVVAGNGVVLLKARHRSRLTREQLSEQAQRQIQRGMSLLFTALILLVLWSIGGIILHQFIVVVSVLVGSVVVAFLFERLVRVTD
jgi:hypothetical protein